MNVLSISVCPGHQGVIGSTATVRTMRVRALLWPMVETRLYECHGPAVGGKAEWIAVGTGLAAPEDLRSKINYALQAAVRVRGG